MAGKRKPAGYWTKERVLADARRFTYQSQWRSACATPFLIARREGWLGEACAHMVSPQAAHGYWTPAIVHEEALKFTTKAEWKRGSPRSYGAAQRLGLLSQCSAHMVEVKKPNGYWTKARCIESARRFDTIQAWAAGEVSAYQIAKRRGWMEQATRHMVRTFSHGEYTIYSFLLQHDIRFDYQKRFDELKDATHLPFDFFLPDFGLLIEYQGRQHFAASKASRYRKNLPEQQRRDAMKRAFAKRAGYSFLAIDAQRVDDIEEAVISRMRRIAKATGLSLQLERRELTARERKKLASLGKWTKEAVIADARRFKTRAAWMASGNAAWQIAYRNGWIEEAAQHMPRLQKPAGYWTKERVLADARRFETRIQWIRASGAGYTTAKAKGWFEEAVAHMRSGRFGIRRARRKN